MRTGRVTGAIGLVGLLGLISPIGASAPAQQAPPGPGIAITPTLVEQDITTESALVAITVKNAEAASRTVTIAVSGLTHDLGGTPQVGGPTPSGITLRGGGTFEMAVDETRTVEVDVALPPGEGGKYFAVTAAVPAGSGQSSTVTNQVATLVLLRPPKPWRTELALDEVEIRRRQEGGYAVSAVVRNVGDVHVAPGGRIELALGGAAAGTVEVESQRILPGAARRLSGTWTPGAGAEPGDGGPTIDPARDPIDATVILTDPDFTGMLRARFVDEVVVDVPGADSDLDDDGISSVDFGDGDDPGPASPDDDGGVDTAAVVVAALLVVLMGVGLGMHAKRRRAGG